MAEEAVAGHNLPKTEEVQSVVQRVENLHADMLKSKMKHMAFCKEARADIKEVFKDAKDAGIDVKSCKSLIKIRELDRKTEQIKYALEGDQYAMFEHLEACMAAA